MTRRKKSKLDKVRQTEEVEDRSAISAIQLSTTSCTSPSASYCTAVISISLHTGELHIQWLRRRFVDQRNRFLTYESRFYVPLPPDTTHTYAAPHDDVSGDVLESVKVEEDQDD